MVTKNLRKIKIEIICPPKVGEIVEGKILSKGRSALFLDLGARGIGMIYGREFFNAKDVLKSLKIGDTVTAKVIDLETDDGYRELSLAEANQEIAWERLKELKEKGDVFEVQIKGANKGGLVCDVERIPAFLPSSQLAPQHYPKVEGGESGKIVRELQKLVGGKLKVKVFDVNRTERKLILSEKEIKRERIDKEIMKYKVGDIIEREISGITSFGAFLKLNEGLEGLIRATEISDKEGESPAKLLKVGEKVKAKVIEIADNRIYLSLKGFVQNQEAKPQ